MFDVLGLSPITPWRHNAEAGRAVGDLAAVIATNEVQAQIDAGGGTRRGEHIAVVHEQHVRIDLHPGEHPLEAVGLKPMGGGRAAVEQARGGQEVRGCADRHDACTRRDAGKRACYQPGQLSGHVDLDWMDGWDDDGVHRCEDLDRVVDGDGEPRIGADRPAVDGADDHLVKRLAI